MTTRATVLTLLVLGVAALAAAGDAVHPVIRPMDGSKVYSQKVEGFGEMRIAYGSGKQRVSSTVSGSYWWLRYHVVDAAGKRDLSVSPLAIVRNYAAEARRLDGTVLGEDSRSVLFRLPRPDGSSTWCSVKAQAGFYILEIVDEKPLAKSLTFGVDEMRAALERDGHVAVYGILFDSDAATLTDASRPVLAEVIRLLTSLPGLRLVVEGHTDSTGDAAHNRELSGRRAGAVVDALTAAGIEPERLSSKGFGAERPVAPNDTEEQRARNRRVELVRQP